MVIIEFREINYFTRKWIATFKHLFKIRISVTLINGDIEGEGIILQDAGDVKGYESPQAFPASGTVFPLFSGFDTDVQMAKGVGNFTNKYRFLNPGVFASNGHRIQIFCSKHGKQNAIYIG